MPTDLLRHDFAEALGRAPRGKWLRMAREAALALGRSSRAPVRFVSAAVMTNGSAVIYINGARHQLADQYTDRASPGSRA